MARLRYRPFGLIGSAIEVLVGAYLVVPILKDNRDDPVPVLVITLLLGGILIGIGASGVVLAIRRRRAARRGS